MVSGDSRTSRCPIPVVSVKRWRRASTSGDVVAFLSEARCPTAVASEVSWTIPVAFEARWPCSFPFDADVADLPEARCPTTVVSEVRWPCSRRFGWDVPVSIRAWCRTTVASGVKWSDTCEVVVTLKRSEGYGAQRLGNLEVVCDGGELVETRKSYFRFVQDGTRR
jgi:hypothetical protein